MQGRRSRRQRVDQNSLLQEGARDAYALPQQYQDTHEEPDPNVLVAVALVCTFTFLLAFYAVYSVNALASRFDAAVGSARGVGELAYLYRYTFTTQFSLEDADAHVSVLSCRCTGDTACGEGWRCAHTGEVVAVGVAPRSEWSEQLWREGHSEAR